MKRRQRWAGGLGEVREPRSSVRLVGGLEFDCPQCQAVGVVLRGSVQEGGVYSCPMCGAEIVFVAMTLREARERAEGAPDGKIRANWFGEGEPPRPERSEP